MESNTIASDCVEVRPVEGGKRLEKPPMIDDLRETIIANLQEGIEEAWRGWQMAVQFEDEKLQDYYMKFVRDLSLTVTKIRKY